MFLETAQGEVPKSDARMEGSADRSSERYVSRRRVGKEGSCPRKVEAEWALIVTMAFNVATLNNSASASRHPAFSSPSSSVLQ